MHVPFSLLFPSITQHVLNDTGPPPQYTPEDLSPEDPMLEHPGDLDLDDPSSLPLTERPPDLPPPMAMLPSNRPMPSNYHDDPRKLLFFCDSVRNPKARSSLVHKLVMLKLLLACSEDRLRNKP